MMIVDMKLAICGETKISSNERGKTAYDDTLIAEARTQPEAFARLYRRHYDNVFRYCVHRMLERHTAEDITSAVFLKVVMGPVKCILVKPLVLALEDLWPQIMPYGVVNAVPYDCCCCQDKVHENNVEDAN